LYTNQKFTVGKCYVYATLNRTSNGQNINTHYADITNTIYLGKFNGTDQDGNYNFEYRIFTNDIKRYAFAETDCKPLLGGKRKTNRNRKNKKLKRTRRRRLRIHNN
jgi:hypothetical protein